MPEWSGSTLLLSANGEQVFFDGFYGVFAHDLRTGKRARKLDHEWFDGRLLDVRFGAGSIFLLGEHLASEEEVGGHASPPPLSSTLMARDNRSGRPVWRRDGSIPAPMVLDGDSVFFKDGESVLRVSAAEGKLRWAATGLDAEAPGPAVGVRAVVVASDGGAWAFDRDSGERLWRRELPGRPLVAPVAGRGRVLVVHMIESVPRKGGREAQARAWALDEAKGTMVWERDFPVEEVFFPPTVDAGTVYVVAAGNGSAFGHLYALDEATGAERWRTELDSDASSADFTPTLRRNEVLVWSGDPESFKKHAVSAFHRLLALDAATGMPKWSYRPLVGEKYSFSRPLAAGALVFYSDGTCVKALRPPGSAAADATMPSPD